jgi:hypothetical protein
MDIEEIANGACENLLPPKSQKRYEGTVTATEFRQLFYCQFEKTCVA